MPNLLPAALGTAAALLASALAAEAGLSWPRRPYAAAPVARSAEAAPPSAPLAVERCPLTGRWCAAPTASRGHVLVENRALGGVSSGTSAEPPRTE